MISATVGILTRNSSLNIKNCLKSVNSFSEIIILDSNSRDSTLNVCRNYNCKIIKQPNSIKFRDGKIKNFAEARNILLKNASHNLVVFIDSDECLSRHLLNRIEFISKSLRFKHLYSGFLVPRIGMLDNVLLYNLPLPKSIQPRIFFKKKGMKFIKHVHEKLISPQKKIIYCRTKSKEFIKFNYLNSIQKIKNKNLYYYKIEKNFMIKRFQINSFRFVFFRIIVYLRSLMVFFFNFYKINNKKFLYLYMYSVSTQIKLSIKLFLKIFKF
jgi:glycosyltransferase involved in cell wall biosynthesis